MSEEKIKEFNKIGEVIQDLRTKNPNLKIVTTNGAFDLMHSGHLHSLGKAKEFGDILVVGLNSDASIKSYKSEDRPIIPQEERAKMLAALHKVDYVVLFDETDPRKLLGEIKPDIHVKSKSGYKGIEREIVEVNGGKIELIEDVPSLSTSFIIDKIKSLKE